MGLAHTSDVGYWAMLLPSVTQYIIYYGLILLYSPTVHDEVDIVGQDGHIYKGRMGRSRLPPLAQVSYHSDPSQSYMYLIHAIMMIFQVKNGKPGIRPSTSPMGTSSL